MWKGVKRFHRSENSKITLTLLHLLARALARPFLASFASGSPSPIHPRWQSNDPNNDLFLSRS